MNTNIFKKISEHTTIPVCTGEDIYLAKNFEPLMKERAVSVVHPDVLTIGGAMEMKRLEDPLRKIRHSSGDPHGGVADSIYGGGAYCGVYEECDGDRIPFGRSSRMV